MRTHQMLPQRLLVLQRGTANAAHKLAHVLLKRRQLGKRCGAPRTLEFRIRRRGRSGFRRRGIVLFVIRGARSDGSARASRRLRLVPVRPGWFPLLFGSGTASAAAGRPFGAFLLFYLSSFTTM